MCLEISKLERKLELFKVGLLEQQLSLLSTTLCLPQLFLQMNWRLEALYDHFPLETDKGMWDANVEACAWPNDASVLKLEIFATVPVTPN